MSNSTDFYTEERRIATTTEMSPLGRYRLDISRYNTDHDGRGYWAYSEGVIYDGDREVDRIRRNYPNFHHGWVEGHPNGHDYLLTGTHYMGQTVLELDTGRRTDRLPEGEEFCFAEYTFRPTLDVPGIGTEGPWIEVLGCYWACPYERVVFEFGDPLTLPWKEIARHAAFETNEEDIEQELRNG